MLMLIRRFKVDLARLQNKRLRLLRGWMYVDVLADASVRNRLIATRTRLL